MSKIIIQDQHSNTILEFIHPDDANLEQEIARQLRDTYNQSTVSIQQKSIQVHQKHRVVHLHYLIKN